ncbi:hypothetical protein [Proteiniphilum propionicum]|jgi:hypothetical protein|uniref:hypothetical protein n=1 Tax=Proteiniphilum propionicum TaxID=2829812 RepID=UPI001EEBFE64|nr:hypothetical protein [Proteiniphilum propionicum]ULB35733.1 hypothetical protein KDN43_06840 [Proteiniphilum propionicum]
MERLLNTDFFIYIQGSAVKEGIKSASLKDMYKNFIESLLRFCKSEGDNTALFFILNYTRTEFVFIQNIESEYRSGEK